VATPAIRSRIREGDTHMLLSEIQTGKRHQMQTMDSSLLALYQQGEITYDAALSAARDPNLIKHKSA
jgi:twitching motility protein PilT